MLTSHLSHPTHGVKRSSSFSEFKLNILSENSPPFLKNHDTFEANYLCSPQKKSNGFDSEDQCSVVTGPKHSRPRAESTNVTLSPLWSKSCDESNRVASPNSFDESEFSFIDDEEIQKKELPNLKESDFKVSIETATNEMIVSSSAAIVYPCHVSIKIIEENLLEKPGLDIILLIDTQYSNHLVFLEALQNVLSFVSEKDRLSLFTTQGPVSQRTPFQRMEEITKGQLVHEFRSIYKNFLRKRIPLQKAIYSSLMSMQNRKYKNHVPAILILTDSANELDASALNYNKNAFEHPVVHFFSFGHKQNQFPFQELALQFEGDVHHAQEPEGLYDLVDNCLLELSFIQAKNVNLSIKTHSNGENSEAIRIANVYESKQGHEKGSHYFHTHRDYFSARSGIDLALEIEVSKIDNNLEIKTNSSFLELVLNCQSLNETAEIHLECRKQLIVKAMPELLCVMPSQIDKRALESFCKIKVATVIIEAMKMADCGLKAQSVQTLSVLKKEIYPFTVFKSQEIQQLMKNIDFLLDCIQHQKAKQRLVQ